MGKFENFFSNPAFLPIFAGKKPQIEICWFAKSIPGKFLQSALSLRENLVDFGFILRKSQ